jgi:hypothetical protein
MNEAAASSPPLSLQPLPRERSEAEGLPGTSAGMFASAVRSTDRRCFRHGAPRPSRSPTPVPDVGARRPAGSSCPLRSPRDPLRNPCARPAHPAGPSVAGFTTKDTKSTKAESPRCRCPEPRALRPHERSVPSGDPTCRSPLLRVLRFFVSFVLFVVRSGSPVRRPGPDEQDRRRPAAVVSLTEARRRGGRVVKPLPRRVSSGERDQGFRIDSTACLPNPGPIPDAPCARWVRGARRALRAAVPP